MDPVTIGILSLAALLGLIMLRVPIAAALIGVSFVGIWAVAGFRPAFSMLSTIPYTTSASWTLSSIPMFLLMGYIAYHSGLTRGLFEAARVWWGWLPGGLAIASLAGASGFAAGSGSSGACSAAIGRIAVPEMARQGYDLRIATGSVAAGGTIGALIPPSIILILFGIQAQVSINDLFLGGLFVGLASLIFYIGAVLVVWWRNPAALPP
ncbi:TRAP transporter large permease subunit, partial [Salipiger sp. HF18]|uniref:TRAP transporter large permease subunit n=1 Tax=Salipiger sp. HF18 TaxID=2721557 RepID=UPI00142D1C71